MKRKLFLSTIALLTLLLICLLGLPTMASATSSTPVLSITSQDVIQGDEFTSTLYFEKGSRISTATLFFNYDPELIELVSCVPAEDSVVEATINAETLGQISIAFSAGYNVSAKMPLVDVTFAVKDDLSEGNYDFLSLNTERSFARRLNSDNIAEEIDFEFDNKQLSIYQAGDINLDGSVDGIDAVYILRYEAGLQSGKEGASFYLPYYTDSSMYDDHQRFMLNIADAYYDGEVNGSDAVSILRHEVGYDELLGNRVDIRFYDSNNVLYTKKSILFGNDLVRIPSVPEVTGFATGSWSAQRESYVEPDFINIEKNINVYAFYGQQVSEAMDYYKRTLTTRYYSDNILSESMNLVTSLYYQEDYRATIFWTSSNNATLNASGDGAFSQPTYDETLSLTAHITSYKGDYIEMEDTITFDYNVIGLFQAPSKAAVELWLRNFFKDGINYELKLPKKLSNVDLESNDPYEFRIEWAVDNDGVYTPVSSISRLNTSSYIDLVAQVFFNGIPLEDDGKIYLDEIFVDAIREDEIRSYIVDKIAENMGLTVTNGESFWHDETPYSTTVKWISKNSDIATVNNNIISISSTAVNGTLLPLAAQVTYMSDDGPRTFEISYTVSVFTDNALLVPGTNIDAELYDALKEATDTYGNLTTEVLKDITFVYLDLSSHKNITDLSGLSYCKNLRVLNISGLRITRGMNEIATLNKLEALIARDCGLSNLTDGGVPVLKNTINLKLLDLSDNNFTSLDSVFAEGVMYGKLEEVYLHNNNIQDISTLSRAPALLVLTLSNNGLTSEKIAPIAGFKYLYYLSLANNDIDSIASLKNLTNLYELRLHNNRITDVRDLKKLTKLKALYLGHNNIQSNIEFLNYLSELEVLYLNDNNIDDISSLNSLDNLKAINVSGNHINSLTVLDRACYYTTLEEVYAENNEIASFSFVQHLTGLRKLMLSGNDPIKENSLTSYLAPLTKLETLTLSGKPVSDLSFLNGMNRLIRLDISDCKTPAFLVKSYNLLTYETGFKEVQITAYQDNIASIMSQKSTLRFIDISNDYFFSIPEMISEILDYMITEQGYTNLTNIQTISFNAEGGIPTATDALYELNKLLVFYADNICNTLDVANMTQTMTGLQYISFENVGITNISWLSRLRNLVFVDLANNPISEINLGSNLSTACRSTLQYLYLDTLANNCSFAKAYITFDENVLKELSLEGVNVGSMDKLPYMDELKYLNIANTGITDLQGTEPDFYDVQSILRFSNLEILDVSHLEADITCLKELDNLKTLFAVADVDELLFFNTDLITLYDLYNDGVECYLYDKETAYEPKATVEGALILNRIDDFSCDIKVAAENAISDNNPYIVSSMNDFNLDWTVSNDDNYKIDNNYLAVKDYTNIDNEVLTVTASLMVYPDQAPVTRSFTVNTSIIRPNSIYYNIDKTGLKEYMLRTESFTYAVTIKAASTEGFSSAVKPVVDDIKYSYSCVLANGQPGVYTNIFTNDADNGHTIKANAPLNSVSTITAKIGHNKNNNFVQDDSVSISFTVTGRTFTATYHLNGGTLLNSDNESITSQELPEEAEMFKNLTLSRAGYLFDGWYTDSEFTQLFCAAGATAYMPCDNVDLYAKWIPHYYTLVFNANGGTVSETERTVYCDTPIGTLPTPTRTGYTFNGWYTQASGGTQITSSTTFATTDTVTVYAHWTANTYTVKFNANGGSGSMSNQSFTYGVAQNLRSNTFTKTNCVFLGWSTNSSATSATYTNGQSVSNLTATAGQTVNLYAIWESVTISATSATLSRVPTGISLNKTSLTLATETTNDYGKTGSITATASGYNSPTKTITATASNGSTITWSSSNTSIATVSNSGVITAKGPGTATITAATSNGAKATCSITVSNTNTAVTWSTSNSSVATVSSGTVTAVSKGSATITATMNGYSKTCTVTVGKAYKAIALTSSSAYADFNYNNQGGFFSVSSSAGTSFEFTFITGDTVPSEGCLYQCYNEARKNGFRITFSSGKIKVTCGFNGNESSQISDYSLSANTVYTVVVSFNKGTSTPFKGTITVKNAAGETLNTTSIEYSGSGYGVNSEASIGPNSSIKDGTAPNVYLMSINFTGSVFVSTSNITLHSCSMDFSAGSIGTQTFTNNGCTAQFTGTQLGYHVVF